MQIYINTLVFVVLLALRLRVDSCYDLDDALRQLIAHEASKLFVFETGLLNAVILCFARRLSHIYDLRLYQTDG